MKTLFALTLVAAAAAVAPAAYAADSIFNYALADAAGVTYVGTISVDLTVPDVDAITGFSLEMTGCNGFCSSAFSWPSAGTHAAWSYQGLGTQPGTWVVANELGFNLGSNRLLAFNGYFGAATPTVSFFENNVLVARSDLLNTTPGTRVDGFGGFVFATLAPVPEPETYALMLAGLVAVGAAAKRRQTA